MKIERTTLPNGLRVVHAQNKATQMVVVNLLYDVGSKDENPAQTGLAHLMEHLMFSGTKAVPDYDAVLQKCGGENNAWTNADVTNFYSCVPRANAEVAFFVEADRLRGLDLSQTKLENQQQVVIEEFKQRNLNQPYGDVPALLHALVYRNHPYRWCTIGKEISHIQSVTKNDTDGFFRRFYMPSNAVLSVAGNISFDEVLAFSEKYFASVPSGKRQPRTLPAEPEQQESRRLDVERNVPSDVLYRVYRMCGRAGAHYAAADALSDVLANGLSARLRQIFVRQKKLATEADAYLSGTLDDGMFHFVMRPSPGISLADLADALDGEILRLQTENVSPQELQKVKNKFNSSWMLSLLDAQETAANLAFGELCGVSPNDELARYLALSADDLRQAACRIFRPQNKSELYYFRK